VAGGYVALPDGWERVSAGGPGPFVTEELIRRPDGEVVKWRSRAHRKRTATTRGRWIGAGFALGSLCFALAAIASQWASAPRPAIGVTFFLGSILFTAASYVQFWEVVNVERGPIHRRERRRLSPASWEPHRIDWLAAAIQLAGTLFFNVSCFAGMRKGLDVKQEDLRVWTPDAFGSVCFLVASEAALAEVCGRWVCLRWRSLTWRIVALNMLGSIAFGVAAVAALVQPSTSEPVSAAVDNAATAVGALCFLAGALMLIPEAARPHGATASR
jgi:predicted membrane protein